MRKDRKFDLCLHRMKAVHKQVKEDPELRLRAEETCGRAINPDVQIIHFFEVLDGFDFSQSAGIERTGLAQVKFVPYYGCMLAHPPAFRKEKNYHGLMEKIPTLHFSEMLALALGERDYDRWFKRHLVDPRPLFKNKELIR